MFRITVFLPNTTLYFTVENYSKEEGKVIFTDKKTGLLKDFPDNMCSIEEVAK